MALCMSLAALTNHSHGEVVYRKLSAVKVSPAAPSCEPETAALSAGDEASAGLAVVKIQKQGRRLIALLAGGQRDGLLPGTLLQTSRQGIPTALLKTTEVRENYTLAEVTEDGSKDSGLYFPEAPGLMVGDRAEPQEMKISQSLRILPNRTLTYERLFIDPKNFPTTFELSAEGRKFLIEQAQILMNAHAPLLLVEGHTDAVGRAGYNLALSDRRAESVARALTQFYGVPAENLVVQGYGESELKVQSQGDERSNRRAVVRIITPLLKVSAR